MPTPLNQYQPVYKAAKAVGRRASFVRQLIDQRELPAIRRGGSTARPHLVVDPVELEAAILRTQAYEPTGRRPRAKATRRPVRSGELDPTAAAM